MTLRAAFTSLGRIHLAGLLRSCGTIQICQRFAIHFLPQYLEVRGQLIPKTTLVGRMTGLLRQVGHLNQPSSEVVALY